MDEAASFINIAYVNVGLDKISPEEARNMIDKKLKSFLSQALERDREAMREKVEKMLDVECNCPEVEAGLVRIGHTDDCPRKKRYGDFYEDGIKDVLYLLSPNK